MVSANNSADEPGFLVIANFLASSLQPVRKSIDCIHFPLVSAKKFITLEQKRKAIICATNLGGVGNILHRM